jgi:hypothetical protein
MHDPGVKKQAIKHEYFMAYTFLKSGSNNNLRNKLGL